MKNTVYTGYFANTQEYIKKGLTPISIAGKSPDFFQGDEWKFFAPSWDIYSKYKSGELSEDGYVERYIPERLGKLNIENIKALLEFEENPILLCYEKEGFCHRHIVCDWLNANGILCREYTE